MNEPTSPHDELNELERRLDAVEATMARLDAGTHGLCETCGVAIEPSDLGADVTLARCAHCAETRHDG